jgi:hypothetical protein
MTEIIDSQTAKRLDEWLKLALESKTTQGHPLDVHIDEINPQWRDRSHWVVGGLQLLGAACLNRRLLGLDCALHLVFCLDPDDVTEVVGTEQPEKRWTPLLHPTTSPELVLVRPVNSAQYFGQASKLIGNLLVGAALAQVRLTDRLDHHGDVVDRVRHLWVSVTPEQVVG